MTEKMATTPIYPWQRYWLPFGSTYTTDYLGFPDFYFYSSENNKQTTNALSLKELSDVNCLILLGEPGSGKSTEVKNINHAEALTISYELNKRSTESDLFSGITSNNVFQEWLISNKCLYLYLDGLDEALLNIKTIKNALTDWLEINKLKFCIEETTSKRKLFLRITCRSAIWSSSTTKKLQSIFGSQNVKQYELAPLTQDDVRLAARLNSFNEQQFINDIVSNDLTAFTSEPVVLNFLIEGFKKGKLAEANFDKVRLFYDGIIHLSNEINEQHKDHKILTPAERVRIASRVATYTLFCKKNTIWVDEQNEEMTGDDLLLDEILNDEFIYENKIVSLNLKSVREALSSSIFGLHNNMNRLAFKHRTYAEFLAAWHLNVTEIDQNLIKQFLTSPYDKLRAIPQLQEVLIWLASMNEKFFWIFLESEPLLMLKLHRNFSTKERVKLVDAILEQANSFELMDNYDIRKFYKKLHHTNLHNQLKPYILKGKNVVVRRTAIDIAGACRIKELISTLKKIADDKVNKHYLRKDAINSIQEIGDANSIAYLRKYVELNLEEDYDDEIKGAALKALYPNFISTREMIQFLSPVKRHNFYGAYQGFLDMIPGVIPNTDFEIALKALIEKIEIFKSTYHSHFERLLQKTLSLSWKEVHKSVDISTIATFITKFYQNRIPFTVTTDDITRRQVAKEIMLNHRNVIRPYDIVDSVTHRGGKLVNASDWSWLLDLLITETDIDLVEYAAKTMRYLFDYKNSTRIVEFIEVAFTKKEVKLVFESWFNAIELESETAQDLRNNFKSSTSSLKEVEEFPISISLPNDKIQEHLKKFEQGDTNEWWQMILSMGIDDKNIYNQFSDFEFDITTLPGWGILNHDLKRRIHNGCKSYLKYYNPNSDWIHSERYDRRELAGYKCLYFLLRNEREYFSQFNAEFWSKWNAIVIYCALSHYGEANDNHQLLLGYCYHNARESFSVSIKKYFQRKIKNGKDAFELYQLKDFLDEQIGISLIELIQPSTPKSNENIIDTLFSKNLSCVRRFAWEQFNLLLRKKSVDARLTLHCAASLLQYPLKDDWQNFWDKLVKDNDLAKRVFLRASHGWAYHKENQLNLNPRQLAEILIWLYINFPPEEDPIHETAYSPSSRDEIKDVRDKLVRNLIECGTIESVNALKFAADALKNYTDFNWWLLSAKEVMRKNTWTPFKSKQLHEVLHNNKSRVVRSEQDLVTVIEESLNRLQTKLQGNNPTARFLWNTLTNDKYEPKDENTLSDFIKMHLDYDLIERKIIINREVEIKRSTGRKDGQRTDLLVQAFKGEENEANVTVVIEVKGCWNSDLQTAMSSQLKDRYLAKYKSTHGIYLVGWYYCNHYASKKRKQTKKSLLNSLKTQALSLSDDRVLIKSLLIDCSI